MAADGAGVHRGRLRAAVWFAAMACVAAACGDDGDAVQPPATMSSVPGAPVAVGDCLPALERTEPFPSTTESTAPALTLPPADTARTVPCDEPHIAEVFHIAEVEAGPQGAYPGDQAVIDQAVAACTGDAFERYVGVPASQSALQIAPLTPSADSWAAGDRAIVCLVKHQLGEPLSASVRGLGTGAG